MRLALALALGLIALGCGSERGDKRMGEACASNDECRRGFCVASGSGDEGTCTRSCASTEECPRGCTHLPDSPDCELVERAAAGELGELGPQRLDSLQRLLTTLTRPAY